MTTHRLLITALFLCLMLSGCMTTKLVANYDSDNIIKHKATRITYLWGIVQPKDVPATCESKAICQVSAKTNLGYLLISAFTLGIVVPQQVTWDCCGSVVPEEFID